MKIKTFYFLLYLSVCFFLSSCSIFNKGKKTSVTKTENIIQKTPSGTTETTNVSTIQTIVEKNVSAANQTQIPTNSSQNGTAPSAFNTFTTFIKKGDDSIKITTKATNEKKTTTFTQKVDTADYIDPHSDAGMDCHIQVVEINANSSTFMNADYEAQGQHIYPGAVYNYKDFTGGNYNEINSPRNPIKLSADIPNITGSTWNIIDNPDISSIRDGIAGLFSRFDNRQVGTMNLRYQTYESNTQEEFSLRLSGGASYSGFSLENEYKNTSNSTRHNLTIDAIKPLFTITCSLPNNTTNYFKSGTTIDYAKNPVIISSVTYGIRILANFNLDTKTKAEFDEFKAKYSGIGTTAHVDFNYLTKHDDMDQTINCYVVGGPGNSTIAFSKDELEKSLKDLVAGVTYSTARPISYEFEIWQEIL